MLVLTLKLGSEIKVGDTIVKLVQVKGKQIRLAFDGTAQIDRVIKKPIQDEEESPVESTVSTQQPKVAARARES